ncbi:hypothetical protein EDC01DRAFT_759789 [Geopyxis carbonaria]|nr:hypothetical protein EDC01DRAFT_759789 [Geopyxis carbonaria]
MTSLLERHVFPLKLSSSAEQRLQTLRLRRTLLTLLSPHDLWTLRATSRTLSECLEALFTKHLHTLRVTFTAHTFAPARLAALPDLAPHIQRLIFIFPHTPNTTIALPPLTPSDPEIRHTLHPYPLFAAPPASGRGPLVQQKRTLPALGPLMQACIDHAGFARLVLTLSKLRHLSIRTPGTPPPGLHRTMIDEALISLRRALEIRPTRLTSFSYAGHAAGVLTLCPAASWEGAAVRGSRAWWRGLKALDFRVHAPSVRVLQPWEREVVARAWAEWLRASWGCEVLSMEVVGEGAAGAGMPCPLLDATLEMNALTRVTLRGWELAWEDAEVLRGGLRGFVSTRANRVGRLTVRDVKLLGGEAAWGKVFEEWRVEGATTAVQSAVRDMKLVKKDRW